MPGLLKEEQSTQERCGREDMEVPRTRESRDSGEGKQRGGEKRILKRRKREKQQNPKQFKRWHTDTMLQNSRRRTDE